MESIEQLLVNIGAQMPFVVLLYYLFTNERAERIKATQAQVDALTKTLEKNDQRHSQTLTIMQEQHKMSYDRACSLYERFLDQTTEQIKAERRRRDKTDIGEHATQPKIGL
jgi:ABC-type anion transport system duplicated permease subunit